MKLYYHPMTCATSAHIILEQSGLDYQSVYVDLTDGRHLQTDYTNKTRKGAVPALELNDGQILTENQAILTYIADRVPEEKLLAKVNTLARARAHEWMNYCATTIHPAVRSVFRPSAYAGDSEAAQAAVREQGRKKMVSVGEFVESQLGLGDWTVGETFTVCDAYLYIMYIWSRDPRMKELPPCPKWQQLALKVHELEATQRVVNRELERRQGYIFPAGFLLPASG